MRPSCSSQKPASIEHRDAAQLAVEQAATGNGESPDSALSGDDDAPDVLPPQRAGRQRLVHHARAGLLRRDHRLEQPAARRQSPTVAAGASGFRSEHQDPPNEPTFAHDTVEYQPARDDADQPDQQDLAQQRHGMLRQSDIEAAVDQQHSRKREQAGDTGVDQQATPLDADFRPVEADGRGRDHDRERQHRGQVGGVERGRCAALTPWAPEPATRPATSTSRR